jgi:hypothetical protein
MFVAIICTFNFSGVKTIMSLNKKRHFTFLRFFVRDYVTVMKYYNTGIITSFLQNNESSLLPRSCQLDISQVPENLKKKLFCYCIICDTLSIFSTIVSFILFTNTNDSKYNGENPYWPSTKMKAFPSWSKQNMT